MKKPLRLDDVLALQACREKCQTGEAKTDREVAKLTQEEVGDVCGVSHTTVSRWENGSRIPRGPEALRYARFLQRITKREVA